MESTGSATINGTLFRSNAAQAGGGALAAAPFSAVTLTGCTFDANSAPLGASLLALGETGIAECTFQSNAAGCMAGGAVWSQGPRAVLTVIDSTFSDHSVTDEGAPPVLQAQSTGGGAALYLGTQARADISNCAFERNTATVSSGPLVGGGAIAALNSTTLFLQGTSLTNSTVQGLAGASGGAVYAGYLCNLKLTGVEVQGSSAAGSGGGVWAAGPVELTDVTLSDCQAGAAGGGECRCSIRSVCMYLCVNLYYY